MAGEQEQCSKRGTGVFIRSDLQLQVNAALA